MVMLQHPLAKDGVVQIHPGLPSPGASGVHGGWSSVRQLGLGKPSYEPTFKKNSTWRLQKEVHQ